MVRWPAPIPADGLGRYFSVQKCTTPTVTKIPTQYQTGNQEISKIALAMIMDET